MVWTVGSSWVSLSDFLSRLRSWGTIFGAVADDGEETVIEESGVFFILIWFVFIIVFCFGLFLGVPGGGFDAVETG